MAVFEDLKDKKPFLAIAQAAVDELESITPVEKAQAVPYVRIWRIDPATGKPVSPDKAPNDGKPIRPLSAMLAEPPRFGAPIYGDGADDRFRERPPVSLERITISSQAPMGLITFSKMTLSFVVHRPDVVFGEQLKEGEGDNWSSLMLPGAVHALEYGWTASTGVKNGLLNGLGISGDKSEGAPDVPAISQIRFATTNYNFTITPDFQFKITIDAYESGEFNSRQTVFTTVTAKEEKAKAKGKGKKSRDKKVNEEKRIVAAFPGDPWGADGKDLRSIVQEGTSKKLRDRAVKGFVTFKDVLDLLFADSIVDVYTHAGYKKVNLYIGRFNGRAGRTSDKYGKQDMNSYPVPSNEDPNAFTPERSIGDFKFKLQDVQQKFNNLAKAGKFLTFKNTIEPFLNTFLDPKTWDRKDGKDEVSSSTSTGYDSNVVPHVVVRTITNKDEISFYIIDVKREHTRFTDQDSFPEGVKATPEQIRQKLRDKHVPMVSFLRGNSYIQEAQFEVINDDQQKSVLIRKALDKARSGEIDVSSHLSDRGIDVRKLLYSSAIRGSLTMIGNFAFDLFSFVWLDFGVREWSGPFTIYEREDIIERGTFTTKMTFVSTGDDPLGTQGLRELNRENKEKEDAKKAEDAKKKKEAKRKRAKSDKEAANK
jgi:hypothetical protein